MSGNIGLNILGDKGMSDDNIDAYVDDLKPHTCTVINNVKLARKLLDRGVQVIYRHKSGEENGNDDDAHLCYDPVAFAKKRIEEINDRRAVIYLTNEPGTGNIPKLNSWTLEAQRYCHDQGYRAAIIGFPTGNPKDKDWLGLEPCIKLANDHNDLINHHDYFDMHVEYSMKTHVGHCLNAVRRFGGNWVITELGCAVGYHPERGWQSVLSEQEYALELYRAASIYHLLDIPVCVYSYGSWFNFGIENANELKQELVRYNKLLNMEEQVATTTVYTTTALKVRTQASTLSAARTVLPPNQPVQVTLPVVEGGAYKVGAETHNEWYVITQPLEGYIAAAYCINS